MQVGPYQLDPIAHTLGGPQGTLQLSPLASRFLQALAREPGAVVERAALIEELWRGDYLVGEPALNRVVSETRRALGDSPRNPTLIQTVHRRGYRLVAPVEGELPGTSLAPSAAEPVWQRIWRYGLITFSLLAATAVAIVALSVVSRMAR
jgi:DNA-binding winged helix-turn-helix (wHTH) protein